MACQGGADNIDRWPDIALASSLVSSSHDGVGAQSDVGRFAVEAYPLRPGRGAASGCRFNKEGAAVSAASIAVAT